jgi:hypothetical protein
MELGIASAEDGTDRLTAGGSMLEEATTLSKIDGISDALGKTDSKTTLDIVEEAYTELSYEEFIKLGSADETGFEDASMAIDEETTIDAGAEDATKFPAALDGTLIGGSTLDEA